jgi:hypothetical protein
MTKKALLDSEWGNEAFLFSEASKTGSGIHPYLYSMVAREFFFEGKAAGT